MFGSLLDTCKTISGLMWSWLSVGTFLDLGGSHQLQYVCQSSSKSSEGVATRRVLPQTPGQPANGKPPSKPPRQLSQSNSVTNDSSPNSSYSYSGSIDLERSAINEGLRSRLKRIAKEIASRTSGYQDRKPPPVCCI